MPNDFFSKLMRFFLVLIVSLFLATILFLIWSMASYAFTPMCTWFQDGDYNCSLWQYLENEGTLLVGFFFIPIVFLMSLSSAKKITIFAYKIIFTLEKEINTKKSVKIIAWSLLPVIWSLIGLFIIIAAIDYFFITEWLLTIFPVIYISLYLWTSKQIKILSKTK